MSMSMPKSRLQRVWGVVRSVAGAPWVKRAAQGAGYLFAVALLALVGSGHLARWLFAGRPRWGSRWPRRRRRRRPPPTAPPPSAKPAAAEAKPPVVEAREAEVESAPASVERGPASVEAGDAVAPAVIADGGAPGQGWRPTGR